MCKGRWFALFLLALVIAYPIENVWAQTTSPRKAQPTGFESFEEMLPRMELAIKIQEPVQAPEATIALSLNNDRGCSNKLEVNLSDTVQQFFRNSDLKCSVDYQDRYSGNPYRDDPDSQFIRFILGTKSDLAIPLIGKVDCIVGFEAEHGRRQERYRFIAGIEVFGMPVCASYDPSVNKLDIMLEL